MRQSSLTFIFVLMNNLAEFGRGDVVTFGGGTGVPGVHEALLLAGLQYLIAEPALWDSGGATGRRRITNKGEQAWSDPMRIMLSLVPPDLQETPQFRALKTVLTSRSDQEVVIGQEFFAQFWSKTEGFANIQKLLEDILQTPLRGTVIPPSMEPANIAVTTELEIKYLGEHRLDEERMSENRVTRIKLQPTNPEHRKVVAYEPALDAIHNGKFLILCPGSIHGSVLCIFLPLGMRRAFKDAPGKVIYVANLLSTRNEVETPEEFMALIERYTGRKPDIVIAPQLTREQFEQEHARTARVYQAGGQHWIDWREEVLQQMGIRTILHNAVTFAAVQGNGHEVVRHNPALLALAMQAALTT